MGVEHSRLGLAGIVALVLLASSSCTAQTHRNASPGATTKTSTSPSSETTSASTTILIAVPSTVPAPRLTMEPCGSINSNQTGQLAINLDKFLLTAGDVPGGYTSDGAKTTVGSHFVAAVPSIVPVAYINYQTGSSTPQTGFQMGSIGYIAEAVGEVGSAQGAAQAVLNTDTAAGQRQCGRDTATGTLPGSVPNLIAIEGSGSSSGGSIGTATVLAAKGPYVVSLMWSFSTPSAASAPPPPSPAQLGSLVDTALARIEN